jgi:hypothetical protein
MAADSIVKAAWARAEANRERLRLRQDLQTTREATDRRLRRQTGWEDAFTNPLITNYRPDEPVAFPAPRSVITASLEVLWRYETIDNTGLDGLRSRRGTLHVASGNGQAMLSRDIGFYVIRPDGYRPVEAVLPYPGGNGVIYYWAMVPAPELTAISSVDFPLIERAFLVTHTSVTEVTLIGYPYEAQVDTSITWTTEEQFWLSTVITANVEIENIDPIYNKGEFGTPKVYVALRLYRGEDLSTILSNAPGNELWGAEEFTLTAAARPNVAPPSTFPPGDANSGSWDPKYSWDGGQPAYCNSELALLGYPP